MGEGTEFTVYDCRGSSAVSEPDARALARVVDVGLSTMPVDVLVLICQFLFDDAAPVILSVVKLEL